MNSSAKLDKHEMMLIRLLSRKKYPEVWYQNVRLMRVIPAGILAVSLFPSYVAYGLHPPLLLILSALLSFTLARGLDIYTTYKVFQLKPAYDRRSLPFPMYEANEDLPNIPTLKELFGATSLFITLGVYVASVVFPVFGMAIAAGMFVTVANNSRNHQFLRYELSLYDLREDTYPKEKRYPQANISLPSLSLLS